MVPLTFGFPANWFSHTRVRTQWSNIEMKGKRRMNEKQIWTKAQREADRLDQFQLRKLAEELTHGMALLNAALGQLGHKIKEEEIITVSAQAAGDEAASWAAKCAE